MKELSQGLLIVVEGIDGSGKSTLAARLVQHLRDNNKDALLTREPGATPVGKKIRALICEKDSLITPVAEYLLFAADRAQHFHDIVKPALAARRIVISDRMEDSSCAYQAYGNGLDLAMIQQINRWTVGDIVPDITLFLRLSPAQAQKRVVERNAGITKFETDCFGYLNRVALGFEKLYEHTNKTVYTLDATENIDSIFKTALQLIEPWITQHNL